VAIYANWVQYWSRGKYMKLFRDMRPRPITRDQFCKLHHFLPRFMSSLTIIIIIIEKIGRDWYFVVRQQLLLTICHEQFKSKHQVTPKHLLMMTLDVDQTHALGTIIGAMWIFITDFQGLDADYSTQDIWNAIYSIMLF